MTDESGNILRDGATSSQNSDLIVGIMIEVSTEDRGPDSDTLQDSRLGTSLYPEDPGSILVMELTDYGKVQTSEHDTDPTE